MPAARPGRPALFGPSLAPLSSEPAGLDGAEGTWVSREVDAMAAAWSRGQKLSAREIIERHPGIADEAAVRLIYEEVNLRREAGEEVRTTEVVRRYPQYRGELEVLLGCDRLLRPMARAADLPDVGESLGPFHLRAELGRGASGRTYLATEPTLADRPVVLKVISDDQEEHLSLARLQHTNIIPLFSEHTFPERGLRALCMPYLGGASLAHVLDALASIPPADRRGRDIIHVLDRFQAGSPSPAPADGPYRGYLERASYVEAICFIGTRLADALQEAHAHGLVHMDVKPSNVLIAADGSPMLLDFHLACRPIRAGERFPGRIGGTPGWMAPEHRAALDAVLVGDPVPEPVDHRADVYALGLLLREALGGGPAEGTNSLRRRNPGVSHGLEGIIRKCLAERPSGRYPDAASLAGDLRRHLDHQPLRGVRNRLGERLSKMRRRRPAVLLVAFLTTMLVALVLVVAAGAAWIIRQRNEQESFRGMVQAARRAEIAEPLHRLAEKVRFHYGIDPPVGSEAAALDRSVRTIWERRHLLADHDSGPLDLTIERRIRDDLLELVGAWAESRTRLARPDERPDVRREVLAVIDEALSAYGPSLVLERLRRSLGGAPSDEKDVPGSSAERYELGRSFLRSGRFEAAAEQFRLSVDGRPQDFWAHFYLGSCEYRLRQYDRAATSFAVCIALAPTDATRAECYFNRGMATEALNRPTEALEDYDRALRCDPELTAARLNRGVLLYRSGRNAEAIADFRRSLETATDGTTQGRIHYNLGLAYLALGDRTSAGTHVEHALDLGNRDARGLRDRMRGAH